MKKAQGERIWETCLKIKLSVYESTPAKSAEMDDLLFLSVIRFLQSVPGPINFCYDDKTMIDYEDLETFLKRIPSLEYYGEDHGNEAQDWVRSLVDISYGSRNSYLGNPVQ